MMMTWCASLVNHPVIQTRPLITTTTRLAKMVEMSKRRKSKIQVHHLRNRLKLRLSLVPRRCKRMTIRLPESICFGRPLILPQWNPDHRGVRQSHREDTPHSPLHVAHIVLHPRTVHQLDERRTVDQGANANASVQDTQAKDVDAPAQHVVS